jgi:uncharacterized protein YbbK (DUF523 family)
MQIMPVRYAIACYRVSGDQMESVLVSACLLGTPVRYNGGDKRCDNEVLQRWFREGRPVPICPEVDGGLPIPRPPAEIDHAAGGLEVLAGAVKVIDSTGRDVSLQFVKGAEHALACAQSKNIRIAVLKEGSPSCGSSYTYDGTFTGRKVSLPGVTTALLQQAGIHVFSETQLEEADNLLSQLEALA